MDDRGFIFTADATLALIVVIVFTASIVAYSLLPVYQGQDHQHLQALADSALATMEEDGTLRDAAVYYANNNSTAAEQLLTSSLNAILPTDVSYKMTMNGYTPQAINNRGRDYALASDVATGVRVISGPQEGWLGRSVYNIKEVGLIEQETNVTTTLWNFHNWLTNFNPWIYNNHLRSYPYWGYSSGSYQNIDFSVPNTTTGTVNWARFIINSVHKNNGAAYEANVNINNHNYQVQQNRFALLYSYAVSGNTWRFYNNQTLINPSYLTPGTTNNLHVGYDDVSSYNDMAWFSLIANYTVDMVIPQGVVTNTYFFPDNAGLAYPYNNNINNRQKRVNGITYSFDGGSQSFTRVSNKIYYLSEYISDHDLGLENSYPFILRNIQGTSSADAVAIQMDIDNTDAGTIKDAYVVINPYGAVDGAMVEVYRPQYNRWDVVFRSDINTQWGTDDGYGNLPGIINLKDYMYRGYVNKVRITTWDLSPGDDDYDLVGLTNCYAVVSSSKLPIWWDEYATESDKSGYDAQKLTEEHLQMYMVSLKGKHYKKSTEARKVAAVRSFLKFMTERGSRPCPGMPTDQKISSSLQCAIKRR